MIMRFHCSYCGQDWERYTYDDLRGVHVNRCPHCGAGKVRDETFEEILSCARMCDEVNNMLRTDHEKQFNAVTSISFISDHHFHPDED